VARAGPAIRPLAPDDLEAADQIVRAAFAIEESRLASLRQLLRLQADGWFLAEQDGAPVGVIGGLDYGRFVYSGLFAVAPGAQGRGVGAALLQHWLGWIAARGIPLVVVDASDAGALLCQRVGFVEVDLTDIWEYAGGQPTAGAGAGTSVRSGAGRVATGAAARLRGEPVAGPTEAAAGAPDTSTAPHVSAAPSLPDRLLPKGSHGRPAGPVRVLRADQVDALAAADARVFGGDRRAVLCELLAAHPGRALVVCGPQGEIAGYLVAQERRLGPWVAASPADAAALLAAAWPLGFESGPVALVPRANAAAAALLTHAGFRRVRATHYMVLGARRPPGRRAQIYGAASAALG